MAETISQHQQGAFSTPVNGALSDASVVLSNDNTLRTSYNSHDADDGVHLQSSAIGSRPAAGTAGRKWLTTDGLRLYYDTGSAWTEAAYLPLVGGTMTGSISGTGATFISHTSPQFAVGYDGSNNLTLATASTGETTYTLTGSTNISHVFSGNHILAKGTGMVRIENTGVSRPASGTGKGIEFQMSGGSAFVSAWDATGSALFDLKLAGSTVALSINGTDVLTGASGGVTVTSGKTLTLTGTTVAGAPTWSSSQTLPGLTVNGAITISTTGTAALQAYSTNSPAARIGYSVSKYLDIAIDSSGFVTMSCSSGSLYFSGALGFAADRGGFGGSATGNCLLFVGSSTTAQSSLIIGAGVAPTSPLDGMMWYDGTNVKFRVGGTTKTFTLT